MQTRGDGQAMLDEKDKKILEMLRRNARVSYSEIAKQLGLSDVAVLKRIRRLESEGIIRGYTLRLNPTAVGIRARSITGIDVEPDKLFQVIEKLREMPEIVYLALTTGDHTLVAIIYAEDSEKLAEVHEKISNITGVRSVWPSVVLEDLKSDGALYI